MDSMHLNHKRSLCLVLAMTLVMMVSFNMIIYKYNVHAEPANEKLTDSQVKEEIERIYNARSACLVSGNCQPLKELFDTSKKQGQWGLEHEVRRVKYLTKWADERDITFTNIQSWVRIKKIYPKGNILRIALQESYKFDYVYDEEDRNTPNSFGVGIRHTASLINKEGKWVLCSDWYTDCFEDAMQAYSGEINDVAPPSDTSFSEAKAQESIMKVQPVYNRVNAVAYADKYCGAAWGSGNNYKYNKKYTDFNGIGGDCTNFASQVLGDKEGGGMRINSTWTPHSNAWANADGLKNYLVNSGRGSVIKAGTFKELTAPSANLPNGAVAKLKLGDLIAYEKGRGNIDHFAVITGFDNHGYPLVNSHTTDRYHVPWDLGWGDKKIRFFLIHING